jgi:hypothetical protein
MRYIQAKNLEAEEFKRLRGVGFDTFEQMVKVVAAEKVLAKKSGRPSKLSIEDQLLMTLQYWREYKLLMTLQYWREYRTYFHMEMDWGLDETNVFRNVKKIENILIKSGMFSVGGKKQVVLLEGV